MTRLLAVMAVLSAGIPAAAQTGESLPVRRMEVDAGAGWLAGAGLGSSDASLRAAAEGPAMFRLFTVDGRLTAGPTIHARAGFAFNQRIGVEGTVTVGRPELRVSVSNDAESAPAISVAERVDQYAIDFGVIFLVHELRIGRRTLPFVAGGAGYLRQLHEGRTLVEEGHFFHAGGGVKHWVVVRDRGLISAIGLRGETRLYVMSGGIRIEDQSRVHAAISGGVFVTF